MIDVGQKFVSYDELQQAVEEFEFANNVKFMKLKTSKLNKIEIPNANEKLVYKAIIFQCIRGGPYIKRGKGLRNRSTEKQDCPAHINLRISNDGQSLIVRTIGIEHNHEILERWMYFKDGISRSIRRKLNLKKMFIRNIPYQVDGHDNLYAALIEPKILDVLQQPFKPRKRKRAKSPEQEVDIATESIILGEVSTVQNATKSPSKQCSIGYENSRENEQCATENEQYVTDNEQCVTYNEIYSTENEHCSVENEEFFTEGDQSSPENAKFSKENTCSVKTVSSLLETQKTILNTLNIMNENIHVLNSNMVSMANVLNNLCDKIGNITHVVLKKPS